MHLLINVQSRKGETGDFFICEILEYPTLLSVNDSLRFGCKADIDMLLLQHQASSKEIQLLNIQVKVFDAAADVQSLVIPQSVKTFQAFKAHFLETQ